jgi:hypothetical protein
VDDAVRSGGAERGAVRTRGGCARAEALAALGEREWDVKRRKVHRATGAQIDARAEALRVANLREEAELLAKYGREKSENMLSALRVRPRSSSRNFTLRQKTRAKKLLQEAKEYGSERGEFMPNRKFQKGPSRSKTPWQPAFPGFDTKPRKPYTGGTIHAMRILKSSAPDVIQLSPKKVSSAPVKKAGSVVGVPEGIKLKRQPYSDKSLTNGDYLTFQPYKGGWLVSDHGESLGSVKRSKKGVWTRTGYGRDAKVREAQDLLDEYYAAGGK